MQQAREHAEKHLNWTTNSNDLNQFISTIEFTPLTETVKNTYNAYKHHGYRKILTKIEQYEAIFSPLFTLYEKLKNAKK